MKRLIHIQLLLVTGCPGTRRESRSSLPEVFCDKGVLRNLAKFNIYIYIYIYE